MCNIKSEWVDGYFCKVCLKSNIITEDYNTFYCSDCGFFGKDDEFYKEIDDECQFNK